MTLFYKTIIDNWALAKERVHFILLNFKWTECGQAACKMVFGFASYTS